MIQNPDLDKTRNIGLIAHIDAGKTTVSERILFYTGLSHKIGEVHEGGAIMDWMIQEKERGITITSASTTCSWKPVSGETTYWINLIDTPGHIDFTVEVQRSLRVLDGAVIIFDGVAGVEPQSETVWRQADEYNLPRLCFINKLDRTGADFWESLRSIQEKLSPKAIPMQIPIGQEENFKGAIDLLTMKAFSFEGEFGEKVVVQEIPSDLIEEAKEKRAELVERIAGEDDQLLEKFLEEKELSIEELKQVLRKAVLDYRLIPVLVGSALKDKGVQPLLDAVCDYLPSPLDRPPVEGIDPATGATITSPADKKAPFAALVFKIASDPYVGSLNYFRVYSGELSKGSYVLNTRSGKKERIGRIMKVFADKREELETISAGQIGATVGLKDIRTGDTICDLEHPIILEQINFPETVISIRVEPKSKLDQVKLDESLKKLSDEDPTFKVKQDGETGETIIAGMGELHLEIIIDRLKRDFGLEVNVGRPEVAYRETITQEVEAQGKYIHQSGGRGQYGDVWLRLTPLTPGEGFEFVDQIKGGVIPQEFIPAVKKGVKEAMEEGVIASYPVIDIKTTLYDGSFHEVDSSESAFKVAAVRGFRKAMGAAHPVLLEPIMEVQAIAPPEFLGDVMGDLSSRRGKILENEDRKGVKVIVAEVPLAAMFGYATALRSLTKGRASFTMEFKKYQAVPESVKEKIVSGRTA